MKPEKGGQVHGGNPTPTIEDYIAVIYGLVSDAKPVTASQIGRRLDVSLPTVGATLRRMERDGLVVLKEHRRIGLTPEGGRLAESIARRHRLVERLLVDILGLGWQEVHEEAHRLEHAVSPRVEARLSEVLKHPSTCPHGNPIPGNATPSSAPTLPLAHVPEGERVVVRRITEDAESQDKLMGFLARNRILPGCVLHVVEVASFNGTMLVRSDGGDVTIGLPAANEVWVERLGA